MSTANAIVDYEYKVSGAQQAGDEMEGIGNKGQLAAAGLIAATAAAVLATKALVDMSIEAAAANAQLYNNASAANATIEEYQGLNYVLRQTTGQLDGAGNSLRAINTFMLSAGEGAQRQAGVLEDLGLKYEELERMDPTERYLVLTDAIGGVTDATKQNLAATAIFGNRYSTQVIAALDQANGSMRGMMDTFSDSAMQISTENVTALKGFDDTITDVTMSVDAMKAQVAAALTPSMEEFAGVIEDMLPMLAEELADALPMVTDMIGDLAEGLATYGPMMIDLIGDLITIINALDEAGRKAETATRFIQAFGTAGISEAIRGRGELMAAVNMLEDQDEAATEAWLASMEAMAAGNEQSMNGFAGVSDAITGVIGNLGELASAYGETTGGGGGTRTNDIEGKQVLNAKELLELNRERYIVLEEIANLELQTMDAQDAKRAELMQNQIDQAQAQMEPLIAAAERSTDIMVNGLFNGFDSVKDGFKSMLADMAAEWLKSKVLGLLFDAGKGATGIGGFFL